MNRMVGGKFALGSWRGSRNLCYFDICAEILFLHVTESKKNTLFPLKNPVFRHLLTICLNFKKL